MGKTSESRRTTSQVSKAVKKDQYGSEVSHLLISSKTTAAVTTTIRLPPKLTFLETLCAKGWELENR